MRNVLRLIATNFARHPGRIALAGVALAFILLSIHWLPARQIRLHQEHFQTAVENRDWKRVRSFLAPDYHDRWNANRDTLLSRLPSLFQDFLACGVLGDKGALGRQDGMLIYSVHLHVVGSGGPIAQFLMQQSETLTQPFAFSWRRQSWKPWDWQLVSVDQLELEAPPPF